MAGVRNQQGGTGGRQSAGSRREGMPDQPKATEYGKKWEPGPNPVDIDMLEEFITPPDAEMAVKEMTFLRNKLKDGNIEAELKTGFGRISAQKQFTQYQKAVAEGFAGDFQLWLQGRSAENVQKWLSGSMRGYLKTPWGPRGLHWMSDVREYLSSFIRKRMEFQILIAELYMRWPRNLVEAYIFYKYIVRGTSLPLGSTTYLSDYAMFTDTPPDHPIPSRQAMAEDQAREQAEGWRRFLGPERDLNQFRQYVIRALTDPLYNISPAERKEMLTEYAQLVIGPNGDISAEEVSTLFRFDEIMLQEGLGGVPAAATGYILANILRSFGVEHPDLERNLREQENQNRVRAQSLLYPLAVDAEIKNFMANDKKFMKHTVGMFQGFGRERLSKAAVHDVSQYGAAGMNFTLAHLLRTARAHGIETGHVAGTGHAAIPPLVQQIRDRVEAEEGQGHGFLHVLDMFSDRFQEAQRWERAIEEAVQVRGQFFNAAQLNPLHLPPPFAQSAIGNQRQMNSNLLHSMKHAAIYAQTTNALTTEAKALTDLHQIFGNSLWVLNQRPFVDAVARHFADRPQANHPAPGLFETDQSFIQRNWERIQRSLITLHPGSLDPATTIGGQSLQAAQAHLREQALLIQARVAARAQTVDDEAALKRMISTYALQSMIAQTDRATANQLLGKNESYTSTTMRPENALHFQSVHLPALYGNIHAASSIAGQTDAALADMFWAHMHRLEDKVRLDGDQLNPKHYHYSAIVARAAAGRPQWNPHDHGDFGFPGRPGGGGGGGGGPPGGGGGGGHGHENRPGRGPEDDNNGVVRAIRRAMDEPNFLARAFGPDYVPKGQGEAMDVAPAAGAAEAAPAAPPAEPMKEDTKADLRAAAKAQKQVDKQAAADAAAAEKQAAAAAKEAEKTQKEEVRKEQTAQREANREQAKSTKAVRMDEDKQQEEREQMRVGRQRAAEKPAEPLTPDEQMKYDYLETTLRDLYNYQLKMDKTYGGPKSETTLKGQINYLLENIVTPLLTEIKPTMIDAVMSSLTSMVRELDDVQRIEDGKRRKFVYENIASHFNTVLDDLTNWTMYARDDLKKKKQPVVEKKKTVGAGKNERANPALTTGDTSGVPAETQKKTEKALDNVLTGGLKPAPPPKVSLAQQLQEAKTKLKPVILPVSGTKRAREGQEVNRPVRRAVNPAAVAPAAPAAAAVAAAAEPPPLAPRAPPPKPTTLPPINAKRQARLLALESAKKAESAATAASEPGPPTAPPLPTTKSSTTQGSRILARAKGYSSGSAQERMLRALFDERAAEAGAEAAPETMTGVKGGAEPTPAATPHAPEDRAAMFARTPFTFNSPNKEGYHPQPLEEEVTKMIPALFLMHFTDTTTSKSKIASHLAGMQQQGGVMGQLRANFPQFDPHYLQAVLGQRAEDAMQSVQQLFRGGRSFTDQEAFQFDENIIAPLFSDSIIRAFGIKTPDVSHLGLGAAKFMQMYYEHLENALEQTREAALRQSTRPTIENAEYLGARVGAKQRAALSGAQVMRQISGILREQQMIDASFAGAVRPEQEPLIEQHLEEFKLDMMVGVLSFQELEQRKSQLMAKMIQREEDYIERIGRMFTNQFKVQEMHDLPGEPMSGRQEMVVHHGSVMGSKATGKRRKLEVTADQIWEEFVWRTTNSFMKYAARQKPVSGAEKSDVLTQFNIYQERLGLEDLKRMHEYQVSKLAYQRRRGQISAEKSKEYTAAVDRAYEAMEAAAQREANASRTANAVKMMDPKYIRQIKELEAMEEATDPWRKSLPPRAADEKMPFERFITGKKKPPEGIPLHLLDEFARRVVILDQGFNGDINAAISVAELEFEKVTQELNDYLKAADLENVMKVLEEQITSIHKHTVIKEEGVSDTQLQKSAARLAAMTTWNGVLFDFARFLNTPEGWERAQSLAERRRNVAGILQDYLVLRLEGKLVQSWTKRPK